MDGLCSLLDRDRTPGRLEGRGQARESYAELEPKEPLGQFIPFYLREWVKSSSNIRSTYSAKPGSAMATVISKFRRNERLSKLAVPTVASVSSTSTTFSCRKPSVYR